MHRQLWATWLLAPVTSAVVVGVIALFVAVQVYEWRNPDDAAMSLRAMGGVQQLVILSRPDSARPLEPVPQLSGPFDLWDGQWWRIPISAFHHSDLFHLAMNVLAVWFMGQLLEPRLHTLVFLAFFVTATTISLLPEYYLGHDVVGVSGGAYAMFAALMVLRRDDLRVAAIFSPAVVRYGILWLFGCIVLDMLEILRIANAAHFTGFAYGWIGGQLMFGKLWYPWMLRGAFLAAHAVLVPLFSGLMSPENEGCYYWYRALHTTDRGRKIALLQRSVECDPGLRKPWLYLANFQAREGRLMEAWSTALTGLKYNRTEEDLRILLRGLWLQLLTTDQAAAALNELRTLFGDEADGFQQRLGIDGEELAQSGHGSEMPSPPHTVRGGAREMLDLRIDIERRELWAPAVDPESPLSAAEGVIL